MFKLKFLILALLLGILSVTAIASDFMKTGGGINDLQPISIGELIYKKNMKTANPEYGSYHIKYVFLGIERKMNNDFFKISFYPELFGIIYSFF